MQESKREEGKMTKRYADKLIKMTGFIWEPHLYPQTCWLYIQETSLPDMDDKV